MPINKKTGKYTLSPALKAGKAKAAKISAQAKEKKRRSAKSNQQR